MNENSPSSQRIGQLIDRLINDQLTANEFAELANELEHNRSARLLYIETLGLHADLQHNFRHHGDEAIKSVTDELGSLIEQDDAPGKRFPRTDRQSDLHDAGQESNAWSNSGIFTFIAVSVPTVFSIVLAAIIIWFIRSHDWQQSMAGFGMPPTARLSIADLEEIDSAKTAVAVMMKDVDAQWKSNQPKLRIGQSISPGVMELASGLVQIDFFCGATMILEGPAKFEIKDANTGFVHNGKLRVFVPERAKGFTVVSKQCEVIDLGTEFAMDVKANDDAEIHVLDGKVWVKDLVQTEDEKQLLTGGNAVRFDNVDRAKAIKTETGFFVGPAELNRRATQSQSSGFAKWQQTLDELKQDPDLLVLYSFQESSEWDRILANSRPQAGGIGDGAIVGCQWATGRWKTKRALEFSSASHRVRINVPGRHNAMTLCSWVNLDSIDRDMALTHPETEQSNFIHWTVDSNNTGSIASLHLAVSDTVDGVKIREHYNSGSACITSEDVGRWIHVATTYDPDAKRVTHYKNGIKVGSKPISRLQMVSLGMADIGNWPYKPWSEGTEFQIRNLRGSMDELSAFSRALTAEEIQRIYEAGKPEE